jgi:hypothetical protein
VGITKYNNPKKTIEAGKWNSKNLELKNWILLRRTILYVLGSKYLIIFVK